jgi:hypothetical protein
MTWNRDTVTIENMNLIEDGMTEAEVEKIFGRAADKSEQLWVAHDLVRVHGCPPMFYRKTWTGFRFDARLRVSANGVVLGMYCPVEKKCIWPRVCEFVNARIESLGNCK